MWLARVTLETRDPYVKLKGMRAATYETVVGQSKHVYQEEKSSSTKAGLRLLNSRAPCWLFSPLSRTRDVEVGSVRHPPIPVCTGFAMRADLDRERQKWENFES